MGRGDRLSSVPGRRGGDAVMAGSAEAGAAGRPSASRAPFVAVPAGLRRLGAGVEDPGLSGSRGAALAGAGAQRPSGNPRGRASPASRRSVPGRSSWRGACLRVNRPRPDGRQPRAPRAGEELGAGWEAQGCRAPSGSARGSSTADGTPPRPGSVSGRGAGGAGETASGLGGDCSGSSRVGRGRSEGRGWRGGEDLLPGARSTRRARLAGRPSRGPHAGSPRPGPSPSPSLRVPQPPPHRRVLAPPSLPPRADLPSSSDPSIQRSRIKLLPHQAAREDSTKFVVLTLVSIVVIVGVLLASGVIYCLRHNSHYRLKEKLSGLVGDPGPDATDAYQELCRQRMAVRTTERPEAAHTSRVSSVSSQFSDGPMPSPSARSSTSSWSEEPVQPNMDISTGHMVLAYMEDHLKNKNRLEKEWEALCAYQAEPSSSLVAQREENLPKNRCPAVLTYDHSRIRLKSENSHSSSDYINASPIMDHDPRKPAYIATQGPLPSTVADFWQMVWESGCVVVVMLTPLAENGVRQCYRYWPDEGSSLYHIYEVHLVSEHIWCEDFLVRSFYLKNLQTSETRTVTQFHFLSWYDQGVPSSTRSLLDFRRKVNKCFRGRSCPIIVHCSDGAGRSGTYVLIDMVLNKMAKEKQKSRTHF